MAALVLLQPLPTQGGYTPYASGAQATSTRTTSTASGGVPMTFAVLDASASYAIHDYDTATEQQADLSMLLSTGAQCVRLDIGYAPWLTNGQASISLVGSVVSSIRSAGKCLIIADASSETYRNGGALPWDRFKAAWVQRVATLAALYHPDYYVVIKEPGWYVPFVSDASTNPLFKSANEWVGLAQNLTNAVLSASPGTIVGVSVAAGSLTGSRQAFYTQFLDQVQSVSGLSFIGFDIYGQSGQNATQNYLSRNPAQKAVWIAETWSHPSPTKASEAQSDAQWIQSIYYFGQSIGAEMLMPFYTNLFSGYTVPTGSKTLVTFYEGRTPAYTEFSNVVAGNP